MWGLAESAVGDVLVPAVLDVVADNFLPNESPIAASPRVQEVLKNLGVSRYYVCCQKIGLCPILYGRTIPGMGVWN
jgi:DNA-directed RNA polymerase subunit N (RpoN/RPB10)